MNSELEGLLDKVRGITSTPEEIEESDIRIAVANGMISDNRVTVDALKAVRTVNDARNKPKVRETV